MIVLQEIYDEKIYIILPVFCYAFMLVPLRSFGR